MSGATKSKVNAILKAPLLDPIDIYTDCRLMRVPGGFIYETWMQDDNNAIAACFIPISEIQNDKDLHEALKD